MFWIKLFGLVILFFVFEGGNGILAILNGWAFAAFNREPFAAPERFFAVRAWRIENEIERRLATVKKKPSDAPDELEETKHNE